MFKNWNAICQIPDIHVMWALALLDLESDLGRKFIEQFPEYFTEEKEVGPYPLSLIRAQAEKNCIEIERLDYRKNKRTTDAGDHPYSYNAIPNDIPLQGFDKFGNREAGFDGPQLPEGIDPDASQGSIVIWKGKEFVVLENNNSCEELWIAPAECIRVDLRS